MGSAVRFMAEMGHKNRISVLLSPAFMSETPPIPTEFCAMQRRSSRPSRPGELHPEPLTDPDLNLSIHPARVTARRLPPSVEYRVPPVAG